MSDLGQSNGYKIISRFGQEPAVLRAELEDAVLELMAEGWVPLGGAVIAGPSVFVHEGERLYNLVIIAQTLIRK